MSDIAHLTKKLQNDSSFSQQIGLELQSAEHASACQLEKWRKVEKCSLHTYSCSHLASEAGPSTSFALDGKRKHENENGGDAGNDLTQSKEGHPASSTSLLLHLGGVADLPLTTLWQPAIHEHEDTQRPARESPPSTHAEAERHLD